MAEEFDAFAFGNRLCSLVILQVVLGLQNICIVLNFFINLHLWSLHPREELGEPRHALLSNQGNFA